MNENQERERLENDELTSRRLFVPKLKHPRRAAAYQDLLLTMGLREKAQTLALSALTLENESTLLHAHCGSGALTVEVKQRWPEVDIEGTDPDETALQVAAELAAEAGAQILFTKGYLRDLPATAERFDQILCVLALHHFRGSDRLEVFEEFKRVLKPGGTLRIVDFGEEPSGIGGWLVKRLALHEEGIEDQIGSGLIELLTVGGFKNPRLLGRSSFGLHAVSAHTSG